MTGDEPKLDGLVPDHLQVRSSRILLDSLEVQADIGFHEFEVGPPQRLLVTVEIWLEDAVASGRATIRRRRGTTTILRTEVEALAAPAATIFRKRWPTRFSAVCRVARRQGAPGRDVQARHLSGAAESAWKSHHSADWLALNRIRARVCSVPCGCGTKSVARPLSGL